MKAERYPEGPSPSALKPNCETSPDDCNGERRGGDHIVYPKEIRQSNRVDPVGESKKGFGR